MTALATNMRELSGVPKISDAERRLRRQLIQESLRKLSLERDLPLDECYFDGRLNPWQWAAGHLFREERVAMLEAKVKGWEIDPVTKRMKGFSMSTIGIERALRLEWKISPEYLEIARAMIGEIMAHVEVPQIQRVTAWLGEFYGLRPMVNGAWAVGEF